MKWTGFALVSLVFSAVFLVCASWMAFASRKVQRSLRLHLRLAKRYQIFT